MHNVHIAESILGLVTSRDRAASTAGDLAEQATTRGAVWFWSGILRTAASLLWREVTENPAHVAGVGFLALAADVGTSMFSAFLSGIMFFVVALFEVRSGRHVFLSSVWWTIAQLLISLWMGRLLARWAPGRELAACLAYAIFGSIFSLALDLVDPGGLAFSALLWVFLSDAAQRTTVLAGAVWGRQRNLASR